MILEPAFLLMYYGGFSWIETSMMPVTYKRWFIDRIVRELNKTSEDGQTQSKALHANTPDARAVQGRQRTQTPSRMRRFT